MQKDEFKSIREDCKPNKVDVLFVGESRPQRGVFFYFENSPLYRETKKAFNEYLNCDSFTLDNFKQWGCWLYDICDEPVNNFGPRNSARRQAIHDGIPKLEKIIRDENPRLILVCKKTLVASEIEHSNIMNSYRKNESIFFLPFPGNGNQKKYREGLIEALDIFKFIN